MKRIDLNAYYNCDLAQKFFNEFENGADGSIVDLYENRSVDYCVIFENSDFANACYFKKSKLTRMKKIDLIRLAFNLGVDLDFDDCTKADLINELLAIDKQSYYKEHFQHNDFCDLEYNFKINGYSQGDSIKVVVIGSDDFKSFYSRDYLTNLFFDCPCTINIQISEMLQGEFLHKVVNKELLYLDLAEYLDNVYQYDKLELLENFKKNYKGEYKEEILNYLQNNLSEDLDYI